MVARRTNVIALNPASAIVKDIFIDDVVVSAGGSALRIETPTTVGNDVGSYDNVHVKLKYVNAPTASATPPITGQNVATVDYTGPIYGAYSIPSRDGGLMLNTGTGSRSIRKARSWVQQ